MSKRQLVGAAAIVAVLATVIWYVSLAPSRGDGVEPAASVRVALSATAAGSGSWVRYLVTVKNLADGDFSGDVRLVDQDDDGDSAAGGSSLSNLTRNRRLPSAPVVAGESAYQVHLTVPSRKSRTIAVVAPDFFDVVTAVMGSRVLDQEPVDHANVVPVAVLSDLEGPADAIVGLHYDQFSMRVAQFGSARGFPASAIQLASYTTVVIDQFDSATLSQAQVQALRDFTGFGGTLVVAGGSGWRRTIAPLPADLLPLRPSTTQNVSLDPIARLAGVAGDGRSAPAAVGSLGAGARRLLDGPDGVPLAAELTYGAGKVVELAYDPSGESTTGTPYAGLGWSQAIARGIDQPPGTTPMATSLLGADPGFTALLPSAGDAPLPPLWLMALVVLLYIGLAGPLGYLLVTRRWRRPALFWATVPMVAAVFTGAFYLAGTALQDGLEDHEIQVVRVGPGSVNVLEYHRVLFLRRGDHEIEAAPGSLVAPLTLETFRTTGSTCERCTSQLGGLPSGAEHVLPGEHPIVDESGVVYGSVRVVATSGLSHGPQGLDARLSLQGGRVRGTVANGGRAPVWQLKLFTNDGQLAHEAQLAAFVPPGAQVPVDAQLGPADTPGRTTMAEAILLRAVASGPLATRGQAVLVGLTEPVPSRLTVDGQPPPRASLAVLEQTTTLASADSQVRDVERKWLAGATGDQKGGFTAAYDILLPRVDGPLTLTYNAQWATAVDVYDWSRGLFVPVPRQPGRDLAQSTAPISGDQVRDGMVRVRLHEPRLSWATNVWVDAAAS